MVKDARIVSQRDQSLQCHLEGKGCCHLVSKHPHAYGVSTTCVLRRGFQEQWHCQDPAKLCELLVFHFLLSTFHAHFSITTTRTMPHDRNSDCTYSTKYKPVAVATAVEPMVEQYFAMMGEHARCSPHPRTSSLHGSSGRQAQKQMAAVVLQ